jgi:hypothetical protein
MSNTTITQPPCPLRLPVLSPPSAPFGHASASCTFCNTCSLLSSRKPADPISLAVRCFTSAGSQACVPPTGVPNGPLIAVQPAFCRSACRPTRPSQSLRRGPILTFGYCSQRSQVRQFCLAGSHRSRPLALQGGVAAWSRPKMTEGRAQNSSRPADRSLPYCLLALYRPDGLRSGAVMRGPWIKAQRLQSLALPVRCRPLRVRASRAWKLPRRPPASAIPAVPSHGSRPPQPSRAPGSAALPGFVPRALLSFSTLNFDREKPGPSRGGSVQLDNAHRQRPTKQSTSFRSSRLLI